LAVAGAPAGSLKKSTPDNGIMVNTDHRLRCPNALHFLHPFPVPKLPLLSGWSKFNNSWLLRKYDVMPSATAAKMQLFINDSFIWCWWCQTLNKIVKESTTNHGSCKSLGVGEILIQNH
jgi:hypothetical protein